MNTLLLNVIQSCFTAAIIISSQLAYYFLFTSKVIFQFITIALYALADGKCGNPQLSHTYCQGRREAEGSQGLCVRADLGNMRQKKTIEYSKMKDMCP